MTLDQLIERLTQIRAQNPGAQDVIVCTQSQGGIGAQSGVGVARVDAGFDWDQGRVLIQTDAPVIALTAAQVDAIQDSVRKGHSWHAYQAYKKQAEIADRLRAEMSSQAERLQQSLDIADRAMFEVLECEGTRADESARIYGLNDDNCEPVSTLDDAGSSLFEAVKWLADRGYVEVVEGADGVQTVVVLKEPA